LFLFILSFISELCVYTVLAQCTVTVPTLYYYIVI